MKLFIKLFVALITLLILSIIILLIVVDPNDYKQEIQTQVKETINRELLINGDINWSFYPQIGFNFGEIELNNLDGFNRKNLVKIDNASVDIALLPLFKGEVQIGELTLNGLLLNLITNKDGSSNLDNMLPKEKTTPVIQRDNKQPNTEKKKSFDATKLQLTGINIENVQIEVQDLQVDSVTKVNIKHIHLGKFVLGEETDLSIVTDLLTNEINGHIDFQAKLIVAPDLSSLQLNKINLNTLLTGKNLPNGEINSNITSDIAYDLTKNKADITDLVLLVDKISLKGKLSVQVGSKTKVRFTLQGNEWDINPYLPPSSNQLTENSHSNKTTSTQAPIATEQEPDLSFLNNLDVKGTLNIAGVKAKDIEIGKIDTTIDVNQGKAQVKPLTAQLYKGILTLNAWVADAKGKNTYQLDSKLKDIQIYPLLVDAAKMDLLSGTTSFNFTANGQGLNTTKIKSGLIGKGNFTITDGELYGINIPHKLRTLRAKLKGKPAPTDDDIKKTDFASLTGEFNIKEAVIDNQKLLMLSPIMRLDGAGLVDILNSSLDYKLNVTPLSNSDAKTELQDLNGITIPLLIKGTFTQPKFSLDIQGTLKKQFEEKAKAKLEKQKQKLQEKSQQVLDNKSEEIEDKLQKELNKLFN